jgi:hypothetical protein
MCVGSHSLTQSVTLRIMCLRPPRVTAGQRPRRAEPRYLPSAHPGDSTSIYKPLYQVHTWCRKYVENRGNHTVEPDIANTSAITLASLRSKPQVNLVLACTTINVKYFMIFTFDSLAALIRNRRGGQKHSPAVNKSTGDTFKRVGPESS